MLTSYEKGSDIDVVFCLGAERRIASDVQRGDIGLGLVAWHIRSESRPDLSIDISIEDRAQLVREVARLYLEWALNGDAEAKRGRYATLGDWMDGEYLEVSFADPRQKGRPAIGWVRYAEEIANLSYRSFTETAAECFDPGEFGDADDLSHNPIWREIETAWSQAEALIINVLRGIGTQTVWDRYVHQVRHELVAETIDRALSDAETAASDALALGRVAEFVQATLPEWVGRSLTFRDETELLARLPGILETIGEDLLEALIEHNLNLDLTDSAWVACERLFDSELYRRRPVEEDATEGGRHRAQGR